MSYHLGVGAADPGSAATPCSWLQSIFGGYYIGDTWVTCAQAAANPGGVLANTGPGSSPTLPASGISSIGTSATPPAGYDAIALGPDSTGAQQYGYVPTAATQAALDAAAIAAQFGNLDTGSGTVPSGTDCSMLDTPGVINNLFNPNCGTPWGIYFIAGLALIPVLGNLLAGARR
jgi:hypothetical protein